MLTEKPYFEELPSIFNCKADELEEKLKTLNKEDLERIEILLRPENRVFWDAKYTIENFFYIKTKARELKLLKFNRAQQEYFQNRTSRNIILKPRQLGFSTIILAIYFWDTLVHEYVTSTVVSHDFDSTERLFEIVWRFFDNLPAWLKPEAERRTRRELKFAKTDSTFFVNTAIKVQSGRGDTINNLHCSELAFWPNAAEVLPALMEAVPLSGNIDIECSPDNRVNRVFQEMWFESKRGKTGFKPFFFPWWYGEDYQIEGNFNYTPEDLRFQERHSLTKEQLNFYIMKRSLLGELIHREYPSDDVTAFISQSDTFFDVNVLKALISELEASGEEEIGKFGQTLIYKPPEAGKKYIIGADTGMGGQESSLCAAEVIEIEELEQVAEFAERITPTNFGRILGSLGKLYNNALIAVESNFPGPATLYVLSEELGYPFLYRHRDTTTGVYHAGLGFPTNSKTRPVYLGLLKEFLEKKYLKVHSRRFLEACCNFVFQEDSGYAAGKEDDLVIAMGIALQVRQTAMKNSGSLISTIEVPERNVSFSRSEIQEILRDIKKEVREEKIMMRKLRTVMK